MIEVGVGGLGDSTNVADRADKVCVITDIGYDHMAILGDTIEKISNQKAGIIKPDNPVFTVNQDERILEVITQAATRKGSKVEIVQPKPSSASQLAPFALRDWQLARVVTEFVATRDGLELPDEAEIMRTSQTVVPARMEVFEYKGKTVVLDGAHNQQKMAALAAGLQQRFMGQKIAAMVAFVQSRSEQAEDALRQLTPLVEEVIATGLNMRVSKQDVNHSGMPTELVEQACQRAGISKTTVIADPMQAWQALLERPEPVLLVTGSFYLMSQIRPLLHEPQHND